MKERLQLNIRMDNEPELFHLLKEKADRAGLSVTSFVISALKTAVGWQPPIDNREIMSYINELHSDTAKLREELQGYQKEAQSNSQKQQERIQKIQRIIERLKTIDDPIAQEKINQAFNDPELDDI